jgi:uncharacterized RDD family membrane protein YckC
VAVECERCGHVVSSEALHCPECGADPRTGLIAFGDPDTDRLRVCQGVRVRGLALLIDAALLGVVFLIVSLVVFLVLAGAGRFASTMREPSSLPLWVALLVGAFLYFWLSEGLWGRTLGKRLCDLRVMQRDGSRIGLGRALIRTVVRLVDFLPFAFLLGAASVWLTPRRQRLGDLAAGTVVVRGQTVSRRRLAERRLPTVPWRPPPR